MNTLRQLLEKVKPSQPPLNLHQLNEMLALNVPISLRSLLTEGNRFSYIYIAPLTAIQHNMALLPAQISVAGLTVELLYKGNERSGAINALLNNLRNSQPDIVGLSECFVNSERQYIYNGVKDVYPYLLTGPDEGDLEQDGGLMLLSKHPIIGNHQTIYRQAIGDDALTNKGALHARIQVSGHPTNYDIFLSHTQSPNPEVPVPNIGTGSDGPAKVKWQLAHLAAFVQAYSDPQHPAILLGDLNTDGMDENLYSDLINRLQPSEDLWKTTGKGVEGTPEGSSYNMQGITFDSASSFGTKSVAKAIDHPSRYQSGSKLDYAFSWWGNRFWPTFNQTQIIVWQSSPGRDISDHYGMKIHQSYIRELAVNVSESISGIQLILRSIHCLTETHGPIPIVSEITGTDEVKFDLSFSSSNGQSGKKSTEKIEEIDTGTFYEFNNPITLNLSDPGEWLDIEVQGREIDEGLGIETGEVYLGPEKVHFKRDDIILWKGNTTRQVLPLLLGDYGEYAVTIDITVA